VAVRLLLDENLSERLLPSVIKLFPGSVHSRSLGLAGSHDNRIWEQARMGGFVLATRDEDFIRLSVLRGAPPKVIWLNVGNAKTATIAALFQTHSAEIERFAAHEEYTFLALGSE
jgi:predicted nuclease of predicted toxin-antitoxin system